MTEERNYRGAPEPNRKYVKAAKHRKQATSRRLFAPVYRLCLVAVATLVACGSPKQGQDTFRVALVTPGSIADAAWNSGAYAGLMMIRDSLGVPVSQVEARTPGEQEEQLQTYAAQGYAVIFGHGFELLINREFGQSLRR